MAKRPLKVFRTSTGFQDAYVAASSRKVALEAWGSSKDLFAGGLAEQVEDPRLTKAALAKPGAVIRVSRGTTAQHLAAAGRKKVSAKPRVVDEPAVDASLEPSPEPVQRSPKPKRTRVDKAEAAHERGRQSFERRLSEIDEDMNNLRRERDAVRRERDEMLTNLVAQRDEEEASYREALDHWQG